MLDIRGLQKTFNAGSPDEVQALRGVDLHLKAGSFVVVIGSNGSGKSTLLNAVAGGFLPDKGRIELAGRNVTRWPEYRRAKLIGRVFQNPFSGTAPHMTIAENLALAMDARGYTSTRRRSSMTILQFRTTDGLAIAIGAIAMVIIVWL